MTPSVFQTDMHVQSTGNYTHSFTCHGSLFHGLQITDRQGEFQLFSQGYFFSVEILVLEEVRSHTDNFLIGRETQMRTRDRVANKWESVDLRLSPSVYSTVMHRWMCLLPPNR